jgi:rubrerythrin
MASQLSCLSMLEYNTALLYKSLSEKTEIPLAKSLLLSIAQDSSKHSALLKGISDSIASIEVKIKDCAKNLGPIWQNVTTYLKEATTKEENLSLAELYEKLLTLESSIGEEYYIFVQIQTLQYMTKEINQLYNINLDKVKRIFESIINDEEHHREILATLKELSEPKIKDLDNTPLVKFQSPDNWINYTPNNQ